LHNLVRGPESLPHDADWIFHAHTRRIGFVARHEKLRSVLDGFSPGLPDKCAAFSWRLVFNPFVRAHCQIRAWRVRYYHIPRLAQHGEHVAADVRAWYFSRQ
jgi:hypothetical protein